MYPRYISGGTFLFTVALLERRRKLLTQHIDLLREVFQAARRRRPFTIEAIVILPDHLHCIWTLPPGGADFSSRWQDIKARFAAQIPRGEWLSERRRRKGERGIWQRLFWGHVIQNARDYEQHVDYIHYKPVKHGLVARAVDLPYSSFHR
ncbi:MAG: transposase, partial [Deltaproteobacteria bacterium]|nr:transposase [Deltaproteobacteria bacterium]